VVRRLNSSIWPTWRRVSTLLLFCFGSGVPVSAISLLTYNVSGSTGQVWTGNQNLATRRAAALATSQ